MRRLKALLARVPAPCIRFLAAAVSFLAGLAVALMFDYLLYRIGLPSKPFIYVSF
ncbi:MAG TPA: hypothetical protein VN775_12280 [Opitutaceae bacterium]|nr:hypothetical protein [Opitutaceae bacterium]